MRMSQQVGLLILGLGVTVSIFQGLADYQAGKEEAGRKAAERTLKLAEITGQTLDLKASDLNYDDVLNNRKFQLRVEGVQEGGLYYNSYFWYAYGSLVYADPYREGCVLASFSLQGYANAEIGWQCGPTLISEELRFEFADERYSDVWVVIEHLDLE